jgi:hypothetical protein
MKKDTNCDMYCPNGELQGDTKPMPDRGTSTGVTDTYGADIGQDATNTMDRMGGSTKSDGKDMA